MLIVIGVSLPPSDYRLNWLLASSAYLRKSARSKRRLIVVNPDRQAIRRIEKACRTKADRTYGELGALLPEWRTWHK